MRTGMDTIIARFGTLSRSRMPASMSVTAATACNWRRAIWNVGEVSYIANELCGLPFVAGLATVTWVDMTSPGDRKGESSDRRGRVGGRRQPIFILRRSPCRGARKGRAGEAETTSKLMLVRGYGGR